jgi:hypothetical protein
MIVAVLWEMVTMIFIPSIMTKARVLEAAPRG